MGYAIKTENLIKRYKDKTAVKGLTLTVNEVERIGFIMMVIEYRKLKADIKAINERIT